MISVDTEVYTALSTDSQLSAVLTGGVFYSPNDLPVNPAYPLILFETKIKPDFWADDVTGAYQAIVTVHCMSTGDLSVIMGHVERIMVGAGYVFVEQDNGDEPDCYRKYMVFTTTK